MTLTKHSKTGFLFYRNFSRTQIVTFSSGQKGCDNLGNCDYFGCETNRLRALQ